MARRKSVKPKAPKAPKAPLIVEVRADTSRSISVSEVVVPAPVVADKNDVVVTSSSSSSSAAGVEASNGNDQGDDPSSTTTACSGTATDPRDPKWGNLESMTSIKKSPYEPNESAEVGEPVFDELKSLMVHQPDGSLHPQAVFYFGNRLAESVVSACNQIGVSGMLYSPSWQEGKIRSVQCGWIPKALLLLCLHEQRFTRNTEDAVLTGIIKDLGVAKMVGDCMKEWDLEDGHLELMASLGGFSFAKQKLASHKCAIFVARAYRCVMALKHENPSASLLAKVKKCLDIMNLNIRVNKRELIKLKAKQKKEKGKEEFMRMRQQTQQKTINTTPPDLTSIEGSAATTADVAATTENEADSSSEPSRKRPREDRDQSLTVLLGMFEEQYKRMGETLAIIRHKLQENQEEASRETREAIRAEILQEMKKSPKKKGAKRSKY
jgi:hypothetical protein